MDLNYLNEHEASGVLSCARYWNEVNDRDPNGTTNINAVLTSELRDVVDRLGFKVLWILEEYAKEVKNNLKKENT